MRRPLVWALLGSFILHLPVLALLGADWPGPRELQLAGPADELEFTLLAKPAQPQDQVQDQPQAQLQPQSEPQAQPQPGQIIEAAQSVQAEQPLLAQNLPPPSSAAAVVVTSNAKVTSLSTPIRSAPITAAPLTAAPALTPGPVRNASDPDGLIITEPLPDIPAVAAASRTMSALEATVMRAALQSLKDSINMSDTAAALSAGSLPAPELLGFAASDQLTVSTVAAGDLSSLQQVDIRVVRRINGRPYQMQARLQERALSHYAKFINRWDDNVMLSNDRIDGRFHVNSAINFETSDEARPQFNGEVTIASAQRLSARLRQSPMFAAGVRTGTGRIALPREVLPAHWLDAAASVLHLQSDARLDFQGSAGVLWTDLDTNTETRLPVPAAGLIITGSDRSRIELSGTVAGRVVVYSPEQLMITGNLVYASNAADSADMLALISAGSIEVAPASVTGAGDLTIQGALFAQQRFSVRRFRERYQGTLHIYGVLVAGSVSATEPRFDTHIEYDPRFEHSRPPAFPSTGLFDLVSWDQHWTEVSGPDALLADAADSAPIAVP